MLDKDLAEMYGVETKKFNRSVKRNSSRFPSDFMFQLTKEEAQASRYQFGTLKRGQNIKYLPYAFTEQGVAMLSSVLNSERAVQVNIQIIRTFTKLREILSENKQLAEKIEGMESKYDKQISIIFEALRSLMIEEAKPKKKIGFNVSKP